VHHFDNIAWTAGSFTSLSLPGAPSRRGSNPVELALNFSLCRPKSPLNQQPAPRSICQQSSCQQNSPFLT